MEIRIRELSTEVEPFKPLPFKQKVFHHVLKFRLNELKEWKVIMG